MSGDLKQYAATPRRLEKLRQAGQTPSSGAVAGLCALAVATLAIAGAGQPLRRALAGLLAEGLRAGVDQQALAALLARHLFIGGAIVMLFAVALAVTAIAARALQTGGALKAPWKRPQRADSQDWPSAALAVAGLLGVGILYRGFLEHYGVAGQWSQLVDPPLLLAVWLRVLCLLAGLSALHMLWTRAAHLRRAMLTHRELQDERKEAEGSWLKERLRGRPRSRGRRPARD